MCIVNSLINEQKQNFNTFSGEGGSLFVSVLSDKR